MGTPPRRCQFGPWQSGPNRPRRIGCLPPLVLPDEADLLRDVGGWRHRDQKAGAASITSSPRPSSAPGCRPTPGLGLGTVSTSWVSGERARRQHLYVASARRVDSASKYEVLLLGSPGELR